MRIAKALMDRPDVLMKVFLISDAVGCAKKDQKVPSGYYNINTMLLAIIRKGVEVGACGVCMDARGLRDDELMEGVRRSTMNELSGWIVQSDKVINC